MLKILRECMLLANENFCKRWCLANRSYMRARKLLLIRKNPLSEVIRGAIADTITVRVNHPMPEFARMRLAVGWHVPICGLPG